MENKDAKLIRKYINLVESFKPKNEISLNENEKSQPEIPVDETEQPVNESRVTQVGRDIALSLGMAAKKEKALWQELSKITGGKYKTAEEFIRAINTNKLTAVESANLVKMVIKNSAELTKRVKGFLQAEPKFVEIAKQVYPKGTLNPADPRKLELAKKTMAQWGIEGKAADDMLKSAAQGGAVGTKKAVQVAADKAKTLNKAKTLRGAAPEVKRLETNAATAADAANQVNKLKTAQGVPAKLKAAVSNITNKIKRYKSFDKLRNIRGKLNWKNMILYGLAGWGTYEILKSLFGDSEPEPVVMADCVVNLEGMEWGVTSNGDPMIYTTNEFDEQSKGHGGLKFYPNQRVWTMDNAMSGTWACKSGGGVAAGAEQVSEGLLKEQNIDITWDKKGETPVTGGTQTGGTRTDSGTTTPSKEKITYKECDSFPFFFGCKNEKIKKVQKCLGMEEKYQTGNLGNRTREALEAWSRRNKTSIHLFTTGLSEDVYNLIIKDCEPAPTTGTTGPTTGTTITGTTGPTTGTTGPTTGTTTTGTTTTGTTTTVTGESPSDVYTRLVRNKTLVGRLKGRRIVYKGPDLSKEEIAKLEEHMKKTGYRLSRLVKDYKKGDKIVFKRNNEEDTNEPTGLTQEPIK